MKSLGGRGIEVSGWERESGERERDRDGSRTKKGGDIFGFRGLGFRVWGFSV